MTYSHNRHQSPSLFTTNPAQSNDAYFAAVAPVFRGVAVAAMLLLARIISAFEDSLRYNCDHNTKKFKATMLAMILFMIVLKGSREEKTEFLHRLFERLYAKRTARMKELQAEYTVWRQRKCWMWGGGLRVATPVCSLSGFVFGKDRKCYDALIPD